MGDLLNGPETEAKACVFWCYLGRLTVVASSTQSRREKALTNSGGGSGSATIPHFSH